MMTMTSIPSTCSRPEWLFDNSPIPDPFGYGQRAVDCLRRLKHPKSRLPGRAFQLLDWQERLIRKLYGDCDLVTGRRKARKVAIMLPRGGRKTSLAGALAVLHLIGPEQTPGGEIIFAAVDADQAKIGFDEAAGLMRADKRIEKALKFEDYRNRIKHPKSGSFLHAVSSDAGGRHGATPKVAIVDELHAHKKPDLFQVLQSGMVKVPETLMIIISTAGRGQENIAHDIFDYGRKVQRGEIVDEGFLPCIFETSKDADWKDERVWHAVNPGLTHGFPDLEGMRQLAREAENRPADREAFRQLNLNVWLDQGNAHDAFVDMATYDQGAKPIDLEALKGRPCWVGVDLSSSGDLTVAVAAWRDGEGGYIVHPQFFCPADNLRERQTKSGAPYVRWTEEGPGREATQFASTSRLGASRPFIIATPGNVVDLRAVEQYLRDLCSEHDVRELAFDPALARITMSNLADEGFPAVEMRQGSLTMMPAIAELERAIVGGKFQHGGNPVLRWNVENTLVETNSHGHKIRLRKGKRMLCIDGTVAAAMAVGRASTGEDHRSIYEDVNARPEGLIVLH